MSISLLKNTKLIRELKRIYKDNSNILDIILFGSASKGKSKPKDIDILVLFSRKSDLDMVAKLKKIFSAYNAEISWITYHELKTPDFLARENIFNEGISLISKKNISKSFGFIGFILFKYNLKTFSKSERTRFFYALHGRNKEDILQKFGYRLGKDTFLIKTEKSDEFKEILNQWNVNYKEIEILIPERRKFLLDKLNL